MKLHIRMLTIFLTDQNKFYKYVMTFSFDKNLICKKVQNRLMAPLSKNIYLETKLPIPIFVQLLSEYHNICLQPNLHSYLDHIGFRNLRLQILVHIW